MFCNSKWKTHLLQEQRAAEVGLQTLFFGESPAMKTGIAGGREAMYTTLRWGLETLGYSE